MKKYEKPSLVIESLIPDTQIAAANGFDLLGGEIDISAGNWNEYL